VPSLRSLGASSVPADALARMLGRSSSGQFEPDVAAEAQLGEHLGGLCEDGFLVAAPVLLHAGQDGDPRGFQAQELLGVLGQFGTDLGDVGLGSSRPSLIVYVLNWTVFGTMIPLLSTTAGFGRR
jgi:hypothetical protein